MARTHHHRFRSRIPAIIGVFFALTFLYQVQIVDAQSGCPPLDPNVRGWSQGATIYYNISSLPAGVQSAVTDAFNKWSTSNSVNGSSVTFAPADANHPANYT